MTQHHSGGKLGATGRRAEWEPWTPDRSTPAADHSGEIVLPGYRDFALIARSDSSEVYRAHQDGVDRPVAVKVLLLDDDEAIARFEREISITVKIGRRHPNIVSVIETGTTNTGRPCIVMEYYDLGSLHDRLRSGGPLAWVDVLAAGTVVTDALAFAHGHGVLHRDVKPQNILLLPTSYVVADFGIARPIEAGHTSSVEWFSYRHASPQVIDGEAPTVADDIWSVGSTLFTLLDGRAPFAAEDDRDDPALAYMRRVRTGRRRALRRSDVPPGLVSIIDRCLAHERADRFPDAAALHEALTALAAESRAWAPSDAVPPYGAPDEGPGRTGDSLARALIAERPPVVAIPAVAPVHQPAPIVGPPLPTPMPVPPLAPMAAGVQEVTGVTGATGATVPGVMPPSGMANMVASAVAATGYAPGETTTGTYATGPHSRASDVVKPRTRRVGPLGRIFTLAVVALIAGGVLGTVGTWAFNWVKSGPPDEARPGPSPGAIAPVDPPGSPAPTPSGENIQSSRIAPGILELEQTDTGVYLRWSDPSEGEAVFIVEQVIGGRAEPVHDLALASDTTELTVDSAVLDRTDPRLCFLVLAVAGDERGVSQMRCVDRL